MNCNYHVELLPDASEIAELGAGVCPVDWAHRCIEIAHRENCGQSVMCRDGLTQLSMIVKDIVTGNGQNDDIALVKELCQVIAATGGCELAEKTAKNVLASLERYPDEWEQHCRRKRCAALVCRAYYGVYCVPDKCQGCTKCMETCPAGAISGGEGLICVVDSEKCIRCGKCFQVCPHEARAKYGAVKPRVPEAPMPVGSFAGAMGGRRRRRAE